MLNLGQRADPVVYVTALFIHIGTDGYCKNNTATPSPGCSSPRPRVHSSIVGLWGRQQGSAVLFTRLVANYDLYPTHLPHKSQTWIYKIKTLLIDKFSASNVVFNVTQIHLVDLAVTLKC